MIIYIYLYYSASDFEEDEESEDESSDDSSMGKPCIQYSCVFRIILFIFAT